LCEALDAAKYKCLVLNTRLDVASTDAAAAVEHAQHVTNNDVAALTKEKAADKGTLFQRLRGSLPGRKKWKNTARKLFGMKCLKHFLIMLNAKHIHDEVYSNTKLAEATDRVPGFSLHCVKGFRSIQNGKKGTQKMVWSSGSIKRINRSVELEMQEIMSMALINEVHDGESVDGIQFDEEAVFRFIIEKFGLSQKAKYGTAEIALTIDGAKLEGKL
jgi:hypothetical protein